MFILKVLSVKRYIIYPVIIGFISLHFLNAINGTAYGQLFLDSGPLALLQQNLGINIPIDILNYYYAYAIGFSYATMSAIVPIHKMGLGVIGLVLMALKYWISLTIFATIAMLWIPIEVSLIIGFFAIRKLVKRNKVKKNAAKISANLNGVTM